MILKRLLLYFLLPAGITLLLLPVQTHRREDVPGELLYLQILQTLRSQDTQQPAVSAPSFDPTMEDVLSVLEEQRERLSNASGDDSSVENPDGYPIICDLDVAPYPALQEGIHYLKRIARLSDRGRYRSTCLEEVPLHEWASFRENLLQGADPARFQHGAAVFEGHTEMTNVSQAVEIEGLNTGRRIVGAIFIVSGLVLLPGLHRSRTRTDGIRVAQRGAILLWDCIIMGIGIVFTWWCLDIVITRVFQAESFWGDDPIKLMGIVWVVLISPFMALFVSATSAQTVFISGEGVTLRGLLGKQTLAWSDVREIGISSLYTPREANEVVAPKQATKTLRISSNNTTLHIMEPPLASTKREIFRRLERFAPESLQPSINESAGKWTSLW